MTFVKSAVVVGENSEIAALVNVNYEVFPFDSYGVGKIFFDH
jgi:hypothetical protein